MGYETIKRAAVLVAIAGVAAITVPAQATVMVELAFEDLTSGASAIVHGRVVRSGVQMDLRGESYDPTTLTSIQVIDWMKGEGGDVVQLRELGGVFSRGGMRIDGTPQYRVGEEVVVFLERDPEVSSYFRTYAMAQGKFIVVHGVPGTSSVVARDTRDLAFGRLGDTTTEWRGTGGTSGGLPHTVIEPGERVVVSLDVFMQRVRALVGSPRVREGENR